MYLSEIFLLVHPLAKDMPMPVAVRFKESQWQNTLDEIGRDELLKLLDTPYEFPYGFYLLH